MDENERPWVVPESAPGSAGGAAWAANLARPMEGRQADVILVKMLLCAAFYPNFLISVPEDKVRHSARPSDHNPYAKTLAPRPQPGRRPYSARCTTPSPLALPARSTTIRGARLRCAGPFV